MSTGDPETALMLDGARSAANELGIHLQHYPFFRNYPGVVHDVPDIMAGSQGLVVQAEQADLRFMQAVGAFAGNKPVVSCMSPEEVQAALPVASLHVGPDDAAAAARAVELLQPRGAAPGRRLLCAVYVRDSPAELSRCQGVVDAGGAVYTLWAPDILASEAAGALVAELRRDPPVTGCFAASAGAARVVGRALLQMEAEGVMLPTAVAYGLIELDYRQPASGQIFTHTIDPGAWGAGYMAVHSIVVWLHTGNHMPRIDGKLAVIRTGPTVHSAADFLLKPRLRCQAAHLRLVFCPGKWPTEGHGECNCVNRTRDIRIAINQHQAGALSSFWSVVESAVEHFLLGFGDQPPAVDYRGGGDDGEFDPHRQAERLAEQLALRPDALAVTVPHPAVARVVQTAGALTTTGVYWTYNAGWDANWTHLTKWSKHPVHFGQDEYQAGFEGGRVLRQDGATSPAVCVIHQLAENLYQRCRGFADGFGEEVPMLVTTRLAVITELMQDIRDFIVANPRTRTFFVLGLEVADVVRSVAEQVAVDLRDYSVVTVDFSARVAEGIESGNLRFTLHQQQYLQGYMTTMGLYVGVLTHSWNQVASIIPTGPQLVNANNVAKYKCELPARYPLCELPEPAAMVGDGMPAWQIAVIVTACTVGASLIIGAAAGWQLTAEKRRVALLYDDTAVAQRCAEGIADMRLEEQLEFLDRNPNPNRIQVAFTRIVRSLMLYRSFLPSSLLSTGLYEPDPIEEATPPDVEAPKGEVAICFTDIIGSTALWEASPEGMEAALTLHNSVIRKAAAPYEGYEVKTIGDAFMFAFRDPVDCILFAVSVQENLLDANWADDPLMTDASPYWARRTDESGVLLWGGLAVRIGAAFGEVRQEKNPLTERVDYRGPTVNLAARCESGAPHGAILVTESLFAHADDPRLRAVAFVTSEPRDFKGLGPVQVYIATSHRLQRRLECLPGNPLAGVRAAATPDLPGSMSSENVREQRPSGRMSISQRASWRASVAACSSSTGTPGGTPSAHSGASRERFELRLERVHGSVAVVSHLDGGLSMTSSTQASRGEITVQTLSLMNAALHHCTVCTTRTQGRVNTVVGTSLYANWNVVGRCADYNNQALAFARFLHKMSSIDFRVGISSGDLSKGNVGAPVAGQRFHTVVGTPALAAELLTREATTLGVFALATFIPEPPPGSLGNVRPVDVWGLQGPQESAWGAAEVSVSTAVVYEVGLGKDQCDSDGLLADTGLESCFTTRFWRALRGSADALQAMREAADDDEDSVGQRVVSRLAAHLEECPEGSAFLRTAPFPYKQQLGDRRARSRTPPTQ